MITMDDLTKLDEDPLLNGSMEELKKIRTQFNHIARILNMCNNKQLGNDGVDLNLQNGSLSSNEIVS